MNLAFAIGLFLLGQRPGAHDQTATAAANMFGIQQGQGEGMPAIDTGCAGADEFGGSDLEKGAFCLLQHYGPYGERHFVSVRTLASKALAQNPSSFRAHYLMGVAQHQGEGNLPKAIHHLERSTQLFVEKFGNPVISPATPWKVYHRAMLELIYVEGEMDHHEEKIRLVDKLKEQMGVDYSPLKAWPLLKLKRFNEARLLAMQAAAHEDSWFRAVGLTALCAIESELRNRTAAYEACRAAAMPVMQDTMEGAIELSNAAAAASEMFHFDEAERLYTEAARRNIEGSVNPWGRLTRLYLRQGRFSEALSAWREMTEYRKRRPQYLDQQDQSDADLIGVSVLMIAGRTKDAVPITERTVNRPDRQGTSSAQAEQNEAGAAIMDRVVKLDVARQLEEEASTSQFFEALKLRAAAMKLRLEAWVVGRRAAEVLADRDRLVTSLRPECPGSIELPEWLDAEVIDVVGPGVARASIEEARKEESLPAELAELIFKALEGEAALLQGEDAVALEDADWVVKHLPATEALLRARSAAIGARSAEHLKKHDQARNFYAMVLASDPEAVRRMGLVLPVQIVPMGTEAEVVRAAEILKDSPLFQEASWGFELRLYQDGAILAEGDGTQLLHVQFATGHRAKAPSTGAGSSASDSIDRSARWIARAVHKELLVPNVDITQADIRSLDGSLGSGGKASERAKSILDEVLESPR